MILDIEKRINQITPAAGYAVSPRRVVILESAGGIHEQSERTVGILQDTQGGVGVLLHVSPGATETALRQSICDVLASGYIVDATGPGLPILVEAKPTTEEGQNATAT